MKGNFSNNQEECGLRALPEAPFIDKAKAHPRKKGLQALISGSDLSDTQVQLSLPNLLTNRH